MFSNLIRSCVVLASAIFVTLPTAAFTKDCVSSVEERIEFQSGKMVHSIERIVDFTAVIAERDLYNSSGTRLTDFRAVIQQDRANLHKTGKPDHFGDMDGVHDDDDDYFTTLKRRNLLSTAPYYFDCYMDDKAVAAFHKDIASGQLYGILWVVVFQHPNGKLAIYATLVG